MQFWINNMKSSLTIIVCTEVKETKNNINKILIVSSTIDPDFHWSWTKQLNNKPTWTNSLDTSQERRGRFCFLNFGETLNEFAITAEPDRVLT